MAIDVYLVVFRSYDAAALKRLEWRYAAVITTTTFIPAFVFLFIRTDEKGPFYGGVTVCCQVPFVRRVLSVELIMLSPPRCGVLLLPTGSSGD